MSLSSFFQRFRRAGPAVQSAATESMPLSQTDLEQSRTRARRRLIGMAVLVGAGVLGFPWLFETQPRPMSPQIQMVQAGSEEAALPVPSGSAQGLAKSSSRKPDADKVVVAGIVPPAPTQAEPKETVIDEPPALVPSRPSAPTKDVASKKASTPAPAKPAKDSQLADDKPVAKTPAKPAEKPADKSPEKTATKVAEKAADKASDKGKAKPSDRYIVQIGAFTEATLAREARLKVEHLGIKTYTQVADTPGGKKIRVRIGPYADKAEAEKAMASLRKAGLSGSLLTL